MINNIRDFLKLESASGILLLVAATLAVFFANSSLSDWYDALLNLPVAIQVSEFQIAKPLLLWINDGLMAIFFLLVGLELKREMWEGELSNPRDIALPALGAVGGSRGKTQSDPSPMKTLEHDLHPAQPMAFCLFSAL